MSDEQRDPRTALEAERAALQVHIDELLTSSPNSLDFDDNFADSAQVAAEQGENKVLAESLQEQLNDVETALAKLDSGDYGTCSVCGEPISEARLEAMPATPYCINHA